MKKLKLSMIFFIFLNVSLSMMYADFRISMGKDVPHDVEVMYKKGMKFLVSNQNKNGTFKGSNGSGAGVVGLCLTSILAHGEDANFGPYKDNVKRAVDYIIKSQNQTTGYYGGSMYHHGFATLGMAEAYGSLNDERIGKSLKKAVDLLITSQANNPKGGWRYRPEDNTADTTVSGACLVALLAARNSGIGIPQKTIDGALKFYRNCQTSEGGFGYTSSHGPNQVRTSIGALVYALANKNNQVLKQAYTYLKSGTGSENSHFYYYSYYNSQALFRINPSQWRKWNKLQIEILKGKQREDGSWSGQNGAAFSTATALLSLALNYRYLPIYER